MEKLSQVRICMAKKDIKRLKNALYRVQSDIWSSCDIILEFTKNDGLKYVKFGWDEIEWNLYNKEIFVIEKVIRELILEKSPCNLIRLGLNTDEFEQLGRFDTGLIIENIKSFKKCS